MMSQAQTTSVEEKKPRIGKTTVIVAIRMTILVPAPSLQRAVVQNPQRVAERNLRRAAKRRDRKDITVRRRRDNTINNPEIVDTHRVHRGRAEKGPVIIHQEGNPPRDPVVTRPIAVDIHREKVARVQKAKIVATRQTAATAH